jgi:hypothetical protein
MMDDPLLPEEKKKIDQTAKMLATVTGGTGALLMLFGLLCLTNIADAALATGIDMGTMTIISWVLMFMGLMDLSLAAFFMKKSKTGSY